MLRIIAIAALSVFSAYSANAEPAGLYGNTFQIVKPYGETVRFYVNADGTYSAVMGDGTPVSGLWAEKNGELCFNQVKPAPRIPLCGPLVSQHVGDTWTYTLPNGTTSKLSIIAGRP